MPAQDDEYELMPRNELDYLRKEVEKLKRNPLGDTQASISLLESINKLNVNIVRMNEILSSANDDMVKMFNDANLQTQMSRIAEQQEKLAKGIVAVADLVKRIETERAAPLPSLDTIIPKTPSAPAMQPAMTAPLPEAAPMQQTNPFEMPQQRHFDPILNEPLPRPAPGALPPGAVPPSAVPSGLPPMGGQQAQPAAPNPFIPDADIPPPPPRRR